MLNIFLRNISLLAYISLIYYFFSNWSGQRTSKKNDVTLLWRVVIACVIAGSLLSDIFLKDTNIPYINLLLSLTLLFSIAMVHNVPYVDTFIWAIILIAANLICEVLSLNITKLLTNTEIASYSSPRFALIGTSITTLLGVIVVVLLKLSIVSVRAPFHSINLSSALFLVSVPILSIVILFGLLLRGENVANQNISEAAITSSVVIVNICVLFLYKMIIEHQNERYKITLSKNSLESERKLLEEVKKNRTNVLKLKHDLKNQYLIVLGLIESNKLYEAKEYIKDSFQILEPPLTMYASDGVLNYLLSDKLSYAKKNNIDVTHQVFISKNITIDNDVLAIVLGNIIDNAIQASKRIEKDKRKMSVVIKQFQDDLLIEVSNTFDAKELSTRLLRKTSGLGVKNIDSLIKEIGGIYRQWNEDEKYYVSVVLSNVYHKKNKAELVH